jgi:hypothetical protein
MPAPASDPSPIDPAGVAPPEPRFRIGVPAAWRLRSATGLLAVVEPVAHVEPFRPNVIIAADVVPADARPERLLDALAAEADRHPARIRALARAGVRAGAADGCRPAGAVQRFQRTTGLGTVNQVVSVFVTADRVSADLCYAYTVTSSWIGDKYDAPVRCIHESFCPLPLGAPDPAR